MSHPPEAKTLAELPKIKHVWDDDMIEDGWHVTFQYVVGRNDTVSFYERKADLVLDEFCQVAVNGEECRSCNKVQCDDGFSGYRVLCDNLEGVGNLDIWILHCLLQRGNI